MTATPCIGPDEVERVASLSASHELQVHARECPRCGALLASYQVYLDETGGPSASQIADADARLSGAIARELGVPAPAPLGPVAQAASGARPAASRADRARPAWIEWLLHPSSRPAVAIAALIIVAGAVTMVPRRVGQLPPDPLRGSGETNAITITQAALVDHGVHVEWVAVADAEIYEVRLYSSDLHELGRFPAGDKTSLTIPPSSLPATGSDGRLLYRVYALRGGHVVAFSTAAPLE